MNAFVTCEKTVLPALAMSQMVLKKASIPSLSNYQRRNEDHRALANCVGVKFPKFRCCIYDCKLWNKKNVNASKGKPLTAHKEMRD
jgi:hypothetical protein